MYTTKQDQIKQKRLNDTECETKKSLQGETKANKKKDIEKKTPLNRT